MISFANIHIRYRFCIDTMLGCVVSSVRTLLVAVLLIGSGNLQADTVGISKSDSVPSSNSVVELVAVNTDIDPMPCEMPECCDGGGQDCSVNCVYSCSATSAAAITSGWSHFINVDSEFLPATHYVASVVEPPDPLFRPPII